MTATSSPATTLHDLVVTNEQTRAQWRAGHASIEAGRIIVRCRTAPPEELLGTGSATFTIVATDGANRTRRFDSVVVDANASTTKKIVFR
jgi:hypothetical protein